jgi:hypothetical protein
MREALSNRLNLILSVESKRWYAQTPLTHINNWSVNDGCT